MVPARMNVVTLGVRDLRLVCAFYESLGWKTAYPPTEVHAHFELGGGHLALYPLDLLAEEANLPPSGAGNEQHFRGFTLAVAVESEGAVDLTMDAVKEAGGTVLAEPVDREWGGRSGYFADPEGNVWEVVWLPGRAFDERGTLMPLAE